MEGDKGEGCDPKWVVHLDLTNPQHWGINLRYTDILPGFPFPPPNPPRRPSVPPVSTLPAGCRGVRNQQILL